VSPRPLSVGSARRRQSGMVLMVGMVMLLMLTLVAVGVIRMAARHGQVVDNAQVRTEASAAGHYALDLVLNEPATTWDDLKTVNGRNIAVNLGTLSSSDSRANSVNVAVRNMTCKRARIIKNAELVKRSGGVAYVDPADASCFGGGSNTGLTIVDPDALGSPTGDSNCGTVLYEVQAQAADAKLLDATATVVQGVEVRTDIASLATSCN
jgi:Tfp pilus assembly protein PilX